MPTRVKKEAGLSDYEAQRQAKIAENNKLVAELKLNAASAGIAPSKSSKPRHRSDGSHKKKEPRVKQEPIRPTRVSSRLKGIVADSEVAKRKADEEAEVVREQERAKRLRKTDDQELGDMVVNGSIDNWTLSGNWLRNVRPANPHERTFDMDDVKKTPDKDLRALREQMSSLQLWEDVEPSRIKITPERIYAMGFHPTVDKPLVFAGDKLGNLGCFDGSQKAPAPIKTEDDEDDEDEEVDTKPNITTLKLHTRTISAIHFTPSQPEAIYTSSYDSSIRKFDLNTTRSTEVYGPESQDIDDPLSGISIPATDPNMLYFTTLNGGFGMHDTRQRTRTTHDSLLQLSEKKIGGFSIHPLQPHLLATASLDRTLRLWDLRAIRGKGSARLPALLASHESKLSVSHAAFNAAGQIATSSYDDTIKIHDLPGAGAESAMPAAGQELPDGEFEPATVVPHNNQTGRWVTILRPQWQALPERGPQRFCIGNMNRFVDVYAGTGEQLAQLGGDGITAVPAVAVFHDRRDWIAGGTASGKLALWM